MLRRTAGQLALLFTIAMLLVGCAGEDGAIEPAAGLPIPARLTEMDPDLARRVELLLTAVREQPGDVGRWMNLGLLYEAHEVYAPALACYARAVELDPDQPRAWYHLALMQYESGDIEAAIGTLERVVALEPNYAPGWWKRGWLLLEVGRLDDAEGALDQALEVSPGDVAAQAGLARVALLRGEARQAVTILEGLLAGGARQKYLHHLLGGAYRQLEQWDRAEIELTKGRESQAIWPDPWGHEAMGHRLEYYTLLSDATGASDGGQPEVAIPIMEGLLAKKPDDRRTLSNLSRAYLRVGRTQDGMRLLQRMQELYPDHFEVELNLAAAYEFLGDLDRALGHADRSIELNPDYAPPHRRKGSILKRRRSFDAAANEYEQAVRLAPHDRSAWKSLGDCRLQLRQWGAAAASLEQAMRLDPQDADVLSKLGFARLELGDLSGAESVLVEAVRLQPDGAQAARMMLEQIRQQSP